MRCPPAVVMEFEEQLIYLLYMTHWWSGYHATLSLWRTRVQIPYGSLSTISYKLLFEDAGHILIWEIRSAETFYTNYSLAARRAKINLSLVFKSLAKVITKKWLGDSARALRLNEIWGHNSNWRECLLCTQKAVGSSPTGSTNHSFEW